MNPACAGFTQVALFAVHRHVQDADDRVRSRHGRAHDRPDRRPGDHLRPDAEIVERFTPSADGSRLDYTMTITDPATFTARVTLTKAWEWRPGEEVRPYECRL